MNQAALSDLLAEFSGALLEIILRPTSSILDGPLSDPVSFDSKKDAPALRESPDHVETSIAGDAGFDGWTSAQLKFKDILIAFTRVPSSTVRPSSQLAALGLDSISAIQLAGMAKRAGVPLSAADVAGSTTLADVAAIIAKHSGSPKPRVADVHDLTRSLLGQHIIEEARLALPISLRGLVEDVLPATPGMDFMLSAWNRSGGWRFQHVFTFKVSAGTDAPKLRRAWDALVERHGVMRSVLINVAGQNVLCVLKPGSVRTPWVEVIADGERTDLEEVGRHARRFIIDPPLLRDGPALGVTYIHGKGSDFMVLSMHHVLYGAYRLFARTIEHANMSVSRI
jgi:aryl carrier-like protein